MNKLLIPIVLALAVLGSGCKTVTDSAGNSIRVIDTNKVDKAATLIRAAVADATAVGEALKPDVVNYLRLTVAVLDTAIASTNTSPATLRKSIAAIPVKELSSPWATIAIANGIGAYDIFFQDQLAGVIGGNYAAITLLTAFRNGINDALPQQQNMRRDYFERRVELSRTAEVKPFDFVYRFEYPAKIDPCANNHGYFGSNIFIVCPKCNPDLLRRIVQQ